MIEGTPISEQGSSASEAVLRLVGVVKTFRNGEVETPVLRGIDLDIRAAELTAVVGASGSGKTTLLNIAGGMMRPTSGQVLFDELDLAQLSDAELTRFRRHHLGFVFQFYNLVPTLTAVENVRVATQIADHPMDPAEALELVGLAERQHHFPAQLSGGEQQRVALARAVAKRPRILFCDEPTGALDYHKGKVVLEMLDRVHHELDTTIVVITHNLAISRMAQRVVRLGSGVIQEITYNDTPTAVAEITW